MDDTPLPAPQWLEIHCVDAPEVLPVEKGEMHPYKVRSRWQVVGLALWLVLIFVVACVGLWRLAVWVLAGLLLTVALGRLRSSHAWMRARSTLFDVTTVVGVAVMLVVLVVLLPV